MRNKEEENKHFDNEKTVYGPVKSWRFGESLGIDPVFLTSTCSFNCIYCQLGEIQNVTDDYKEFVVTEKVVSDFKEIYESDKKIDVITYSGSGEPTLASNLGEMIDGIREVAPEIPQYVLTNATELYRDEVIENVKKLDKIIVKIDAPNEEIFKLVNRPAEGVTLKRTLEGIEKLKNNFSGEIEVQSMFMPVNLKYIEDFAAILKQVNPTIVQLNTPKRPYPVEWHRENRGNHLEVFDYDTRVLKTISKEDALVIEEKLRNLSGLEILSVYR